MSSVSFALALIWGDGAPVQAGAIAWARAALAFPARTRPYREEGGLILAELTADFPEAFDAPECDAIVALAAAGGAAARPATVWGGAAYVVDERVRSVSRSYHPREAGTAWVYDRLDLLFARAAARFGIAVAPAAEDFQLLRYDVGSHFQAWHTDAGADLHDARLISVSVELSDPADYDGGVLEIAQAVRAARLGRGGARFFLSRLIHRVTPVTRGTRWSLVNWTGRP
jgi:PKHD-type hydroxylase